MPLLWRYLLSQYIKVFTLCVFAFVAILLIMRLDEIAYFATLGPQAAHIILFAFHQIPYIIPIALPISALISASLLIQGLSNSRELMAMRACGYSLRDILTPVIIASLFFSAMNFYIVSELSTASHLNAGMLKNQLRSINPLLLLHNKHVMQIKGFYFDTLGPSRIGDFAKDIIFFSPGRHDNRLNMMIAKHLQASSQNFSAYQVTLLTSQQHKENHEFENLIMENMEKTSTSIQDFSQMFEKKIWTINHDHLQLPQLLVRIQEARNFLIFTLNSSKNKKELKEAEYAFNRCISEINRRISVALAVFSFTFMGLAFGMNFGRISSTRDILFIVILSTASLIAFFVAKSFDYDLIKTSLLYLAPHLIICGISLWKLNKVSKGVE